MFIWKVVIFISMWKTVPAASLASKRSLQDNQLSNTLIACEHKEFHVDCMKSGVIHIIGASYGRSRFDTCNEDGRVWWLGANCKSDKSHRIMTDSCEGKSTCSVEVSNDVFGDPCPGTEKYLDVQYSCVPTPTVTRTTEQTLMLNGSSASEHDAVTNSSLDHRSLKTLYACEHKQLYVDCAESGVIHIIKAMYGRLNRDICNEDGGSAWPKKPCMSDKSYPKTTDRCEQKKTCSIAATNSVFGDPCSGIIKYLEVEYSCVPQPTVTSTTKSSTTHNTDSTTFFDTLTNNSLDNRHLRTIFSCETKVLHVDCVEGGVIHITRANYGRLNRDMCNEYGNVTWSGAPCISGKSLLIVTDRCEQKESCTVATSHEIFGDPCFGTVKYLEVQYSCVPPATVTSTTEKSSIFDTPSTSKPHIVTKNSLADNRHFMTIYACEDQQLQVRCVEGGVIHIIRANYGRLNRDTCNEDGNAGWPGGLCTSDRSNIIMTERCEQKKTCNVLASYTIFGDPCSGFRKYLEVHYSCVPPDNQHFMTIYASEDQQLQVRCVEDAVIHIIRTNYGRLSRDIYNEDGNSGWPGGPCTSDRSNIIITERCEQKKTCNVLASYTIFGDPCSGVRKYLEVHYSCVPRHAQSSEADDSIHCPGGWFYFRDKCYKIGGKRESGRLNREQAKEKCKSEGGHLVTIHSREIQDFLVTFLLLDVKDNAWIGLNDIVNESIYTWEDGSAFSYNNWPSTEPTGTRQENEDCVEICFMLFFYRDGGTGQWNDVDCNVRRAYICEAETSRETSPDPRLCSNGGWKHLSTCYHVISEIKSWDDAEQHCRNTYNGHLITILDFTVDLFLQYILSNTDRDVWIGIKIQEQSLQKWESGWYVGYHKWGKDANEEFVLGTCVLRSKHKSWKRVPCARKYSFICEAPSAGPPVLKQAVKGAKCPELPEDWLDLDGEYCYYFDMKSKQINWYKANMECIRRGGSLVSIHSQEETTILQKFVIYTQSSVHIGFLRPKAHEDQFIWTDGSRWNYQNWDRNQPNNEDEKCGEMFTETMKWNDASGDLECGYICSVRKVLPNVTHHIEQIECTNSASFKVVIGVSVCILLVVILIGCVIYCFRTGGVQRRKTSAGVELQPPVPTSRRPRYRSSDIPNKDENEYYENMGWGSDSK